MIPLSRTVFFCLVPQPLDGSRESVIDRGCRLPAQRCISEAGFSNADFLVGSVAVSAKNRLNSLVCQLDYLLHDGTNGCECARAKVDGHPINSWGVTGRGKYIDHIVYINPIRLPVPAGNL